ncbi:4Fe-4S binding protein [Candidatus Ozemobacteraceae bacterium]|nr:4Fe-4S binding protein [Candidatus Ozemobacteraceae bacterium]
MAVASRRGGLAATALATDLAILFAARAHETALVDADAVVPAVSARLDVTWAEETQVGGMQPGIDLTRCQRCGACSDFCAFDSLDLEPGGIRFTPDRCVACGGCRKVCPSGAISEHQRLLGVLRKGRAGPHLTLFEAKLAPDALPWNAAMTAWLRQSARGFPIQIVKAVPGMGRASREAWYNADLVLWLDDCPSGKTANSMSLPGIEASRVIRVRCRTQDATSSSELPGNAPDAEFGVPESVELATALAHTGRFLQQSGPWTETVHAIFSRVCANLAPVGNDEGMHP